MQNRNGELCCFNLVWLGDHLLPPSIVPYITHPKHGTHRAKMIQLYIPLVSNSQCVDIFRRPTVAKPYIIFLIRSFLFVCFLYSQTPFNESMSSLTRASPRFLGLTIYTTPHYILETCGVNRVLLILLK